MIVNTKSGGGDNFRELSGPSWPTWRRAHVKKTDEEER
jgi:hypothetical protein